MEEKIKKAEQKMKEKQRNEENSSFDGTPRSNKSHVSIEGTQIPIEKPKKLTVEDQFKEAENQTLSVLKSKAP